MQPYVDNQVPEQYRTGMYLYQTTTGRWYKYTQELAGREDVLLYNNGMQVHNPNLGINQSRHKAEQTKGNELPPEMQQALQRLEQENAALKQQVGKVEDMQAQLESLQRQMQQAAPAVPTPTPGIQLGKLATA